MNQLWVLYDCPDGCPADVQSLAEVVAGTNEAGRPVALAPYPGMETRFALVAWRYLLRLNTVERSTIDAFIAAHACRFNPAGGPFCRDRDR